MGRKKQKNKINPLFTLSLAMFLSLGAAKAFAALPKMTLLGLIASTSQSNPNNVALFKDESSGRVFPLKQGSSEIGVRLVRVLRKSAEVEYLGKIYKVDLWSSTSSATEMLAGSRTNALPSDLASNIDRDHTSGLVRVPENLKEKLIKENLGSVLMQAAAVPVSVEGALKGFQFWDIEPNSIYEIAGLKNGDIVTGINGHKIRDPGSAMRQLAALKTAKEAQFSYERNGVEQVMKIVIQ